MIYFPEGKSKRHVNRRRVFLNFFYFDKIHQKPIGSRWVRCTHRPNHRKRRLNTKAEFKLNAIRRTGTASNWVTLGVQDGHRDGVGRERDASLSSLEPLEGLIISFFFFFLLVSVYFSYGTRGVFGEGGMGWRRITSTETVEKTEIHLIARIKRALRTFVASVRQNVKISLRTTRRKKNTARVKRIRVVV